MLKLSRVVVNNEGDLQTTRLPNNEELMNKLNEIVGWINKYEGSIQKLDFDYKYKNPFRR